MKDQRRKTTIYDIARLSGASPSTVSAALNGNWRSRRINEATVESIRKIAADQGYSANLQARGLRRARSGLVGLLIPGHDNRFFTSLSKSFEALARERGLVPVIASTLRSPTEEQRITETLIAYSVDFLFIAGAREPDALSALCSAAHMRHIFVDLEGGGAPSVVSDNYAGAASLTRALLAEIALAPAATPRHRAYFIGGDTFHGATRDRIQGFRDVLAAAGLPAGEDQIMACGYSSAAGSKAVAELVARLGGLPSLLFLNSQTVLEGALEQFVHMAPDAFAHSAIGCWDYSPLAAFLQFPLHMMRQNSQEIIRLAYDLVDRGETAPQILKVLPELVAPRTIYNSQFRNFG